MLLQNNSQLLFSVDIRLLFDDGSTKSGVFNVNDYLLLKFNYNGNKLLKACKLLDIRPVVMNTQPESYSSKLVIDCSDKFAAKRLIIPTKDILNFRIVNKDFIDSLAPDYKVTEDMFKGDMLAPVPEEKYKRPGVNIGGVGQARFIR